MLENAMWNLKIALSGLSVPPVCDHGIFTKPL